MQKERLKYIDNAKGWLIFLMVFGHVFLDDELVPVVNWIYVFHMPAFFIINGILFHYSRSIAKPFGKTFLHYIYTIFVPLIFSEAVGALCYIIRFGYTQNIFGFAYNALHYHFNNGPDWFLVVLFVTDIVFVAIYKGIKNNAVRFGLSVVIMVTSFVLPESWFIIRSMGISFGCICIGYYGCRFFAEHENKWTFWGLFALTVLITGINGGEGLFQGGVSLNIARVNNPLLWTVGAVAGTYCVLYVGKRINMPGLSYIGKNSLIVMITHQLIMLPIRHYTGIAEFNLLQGFAVLLITMGLQFPLCWFLNHYLPFCVGKRFRGSKK